MNSTSTATKCHDLHDHALSFIRQSQMQNKTPFHNELINRCVAHLQGLSDVSSVSATRIAAQALGEYESCGGRRAYMDIDSSTGYTIFVRDPETGRTLMFSAAGLVRIARLALPSLFQGPPHPPYWISFDPCGADPGH